MKTFFLLVLCLVVVSANYAGHKVVRAYLENEKQIAVVNSWELDVWSRDSSVSVGWNDILYKNVLKEEKKEIGVSCL